MLAEISCQGLMPAAHRFRESIHPARLFPALIPQPAVLLLVREEIVRQNIGPRVKQDAIARLTVTALLTIGAGFVADGLRVGSGQPPPRSEERLGDHELVTVRVGCRPIVKETALALVVAVVCSVVASVVDPVAPGHGAWLKFAVHGGVVAFPGPFVSNDTNLPAGGPPHNPRPPVRPEARLA